MAAKEIWTASSLSRLISLKPDLLKAFIDNRAHRRRAARFNIFYRAMEERDEDAERARKLVESWVDMAFPSSREDETSPGPLLTSGKWRNDPRCKGFFQTQQSLAEEPHEALPLLNAYREELGLSPVDADHPSLVPPELSDEHRGRTIPPRRGNNGQNAQVLAKKTRKNKKGAGKRKFQTSNRGPSSKRNKKSALALGKLPESDQETDDWSDIPDGPPQPDYEYDPQQSGRDALDEADAHRLGPEVDGEIKEAPDNRSSVRLAITKSLKRQTVASRPTRSTSKSALAHKSEAQKLGKPQPRAKPPPRLKKVPAVFVKTDIEELEYLIFGSGSSLSPLSSLPEVEDPGDILLKYSAPLHREVGTHAMDVDVEPPLANTSSYNDARDLINEEPVPPLEDTPLVGTSPLTGALPSPHASSVPPSNQSSSIAWSDSNLSQYVRIPVWAKSRQELCELPYFKSMQGGVYTRGGTVYGYLLGRFPSPRDAWCHGGRLIISHGGGKNVMDEGESDPTKAKHQLGDDQLESDKSIRALLTSYRMFRPIVILAEADYEHLRKFNLKQGYAEGASYYVLGHYAIVAAWAEHEEVMTQGLIHTRWKFAFQYIEGDQGPPWWLQTPGANTTPPEPPSIKGIAQVSGERRRFGGLVSGNRMRVSEVTTESFTGQDKAQSTVFTETTDISFVSVPSTDCNECRTLSPYVYALGPICLNPDCSSFWKLNGLPVSQAGLTFNPDFLVLRGLPKALQKIPYPIVPEYPDWQYRKTGESIFNRHYWAGACCHRCGRVSCRQKWQCWECLTCGLLRQESRPQIYVTSCLFGPMDCETQGGAIFSAHDMKSTSRVVKYNDGLNRLVIYYELPDNVGRIVHILNNPAVTQKADQLFQQYQQDASSMNMFQRHAMKTHGVRGELYAQHYSHNAGAPYKYIAQAISTPFEDCPSSVVEAKDHIQYLCEPALHKKVKFNEVLSIAYAVSTNTEDGDLTLTNGRTQEGQEMNFHSDDEPGLGPVIAGLTLGSHAEMLFRYHIACKKNLIYKNGPFRPSEARASDDLDSNDRVLQIILSHGDLLIMDGTDIQKQYEHAVFVRDTDMVRFAATARLIDPRPLAPTIVHDVYPGRNTHQVGADAPYTVAWNSQDSLQPFIQAQAPRMDRRGLYSPSQDLAQLSHDSDVPAIATNINNNTYYTSH